MKRKFISKKFLAMGLAATFVLSSVTGTYATETTSDVLAVKETSTKAAVQVKENGTVLAATDSVELGMVFTLPSPTTVPEGKEFAGWMLNGGTVYAAGEAVTLSAELGNLWGDVHTFTFEAVYNDVEKPAATAAAVQVIENGTVLAATDKVAIGNVFELPSPTTVPEGKEFAGWMLNGGTVYAAGEAVTLTAELGNLWGDVYTFTFEAVYNDVEKPAATAAAVQVIENGTVLAATDKVAIGNVFELPSPTTVPEGKEFTGWMLNDNGEVLYGAGEAVTLTAELGNLWGDVYTFTFEAVYKDAEKPAVTAAAVQVMEDGKVIAATDKVELGNVFELPSPTTVPEGKEFTGWMLNDNGEVLYGAGEAVTLTAELGNLWGDVYTFTFEAVYKDAEKPAITAAAVQVRENGNVIAATDKVSIGDVFGLPTPTTVPEGKEFAGWMLNGDNTVLYTAGQDFVLSEELGYLKDGFDVYAFTFDAVYTDVAEELKTAVQIMENGKVMAVAKNVELGSIFHLPNLIGEVPEGKEFVGWMLNDNEAVLYQAGDTVTITEENGILWGGVYSYTFDAVYKEAVKEVGYIQFEGIDDYTEVALGTTVELMSNYHGEVPEGKVFAGWTLGEKSYAPGAEFTFSKENAVDMGTNDEGVHGYLFSFKAEFADAVKEVGYIQFEGIDDYTEVTLGTTVELMSNYHGEVPEGKEFVGWMLGEEEYVPGGICTFSKENAVDMGTNEEGIHGYLFSFKAMFQDIETEAPQTETETETEAPQTETETETEAPQTETETEEPQTETETEEPESETDAQDVEDETDTDKKNPTSDSKDKNGSNDKKEETKTTEKTNGAVKTGDNTAVAVYVVLFVVAGALVVALMLGKKRA